MFGTVGLLLLISAGMPVAAWGGEPAGVRPALAQPMIWRTERHVNVTSGERTCLVISLGGNVIVVYTRTPGGGRSITVRVGAGNQPGSLRYLRLNRDIYQTADDSFTGEKAEDIVERLRRPGEFAFEWEHRPAPAKQAGLFGTGNFSARADDCLSWFGGRKI